MIPCLEDLMNASSSQLVDFVNSSEIDDEESTKKNLVLNELLTKIHIPIYDRYKQIIGDNRYKNIRNRYR
jgi:hypothetical protein